MFNWLGNLFPYSDLHSLNLDWLLSKMKETAAQAAKAIADSASALAQVIEAKTAAQDAQTAAQNAQTAANHAQTAADNAATSAENAVTVAQAAKSAAQTAQNTADAAKSAAQTAQNTAQTAQSAAQTAQSAANNALSKFPVKREDIAELAVGNKQIGVGAVSSDKIANLAIITSNIADGAVTNAKMSKATFYVGIGSYSQSLKTTSAEIAAGHVSLSFSRSETKAVIFVLYAENNYKVGDTPHQLYFYSDPFIINRTASKRVIDITLADLNTVTGENTEYKGNVTVSVSTSLNVTCQLSFAETLPFSDDIQIPFGISGLSARPLS